jgi:hypothetical protein
LSPRMSAGGGRRAGLRLAAKPVKLFAIDSQN